MKKDEKNIDQKKFMDLLIKEIDEPPQYDIILSLSDLYMKMENNLIRENEEKNKLIKFIIINIEDEKELEIKLEEIKKSDKKKFTEKVINLAEELLLKKGDEEFINKIKSKIVILVQII